MVQTSTKERLVTEAMRLFSEQGYKGTSIHPDREGGGPRARLRNPVPNHFKTKEAVLAAGIDRQLDRRRAMHDIQRTVRRRGGAADRTHAARPVCAECVESGKPVPAGRGPHPGGSVRSAGRRLRRSGRRPLQRTSGLDQGLYAPGLDQTEARRIAVVGVNALLGKQATRVVFHALGGHPG